MLQNRVASFVEVFLYYELLPALSYLPASGRGALKGIGTDRDQTHMEPVVASSELVWQSGT